jgi:NADH:ubiquinone oxidoreductase subunit F (NADH-binding)/(2Fe-2S) ferredoxin/Pyruvate/2-oxoacid:ferredoxin oxidoreductase delta subunit
MKIEQPAAIVTSPDQLETLRKAIQSRTREGMQRITVCAGTGCVAKGSMKVFEAIKKRLEHDAVGALVEFKTSGCHGFCENGPLVVIQPADVLYMKVREKDVEEIISRTVLKGEIVEKLLYKDPASGARARNEREIPFYRKQMRVVLRNIGTIDPMSIEEYIGVGGYRSLAKALSGMTSDEIISTIERSGLRGRGGGGFPTGKKWRSCRAAEGATHYIVCNGDEGDPGAFMDRSLMEGDPHSILEGMIIGAYAIGASEGFIYVRMEYPLAIQRLTHAIKEARRYGLLGENILGSGFAFDVRINRGGGAFICGESTALMASLEGRAGEPRAKYVHTVERGLWEMPTNLNNVETWANVPVIIDKGAEWFAGLGTDTSKGTKVFSLVGKVNNTGLVEVPMGITLREILFDIGGGVKGKKKFKAVQTGGPSGGCLVVDLEETGRKGSFNLIDLPVDFDRLTEAGSMMGSGGMIVMDEDDCMVDVAKYFLSFLKEESCGKCVPCREGIRHMLTVLERITNGTGTEADLVLLEELAETIAEASLCALGTQAPNPILSTLKYFRSEYEAHIRDKKCPAGVCKALISYSIDADACTGCTLCAKNCPSRCISGETKKPHSISVASCIKCGICYDVCKFDAVVRS